MFLPGDLPVFCAHCCPGGGGGGCPYHRAKRMLLFGLSFAKLLGSVQCF